MSQILDDDQNVPLAPNAAVGSERPAFLYVNEQAWKKELNKYERIDNIYFLFLGLLLIPLLFALSIFAIPWFWLIYLILIFWLKSRHYQKYITLADHTAFRFMVGQDRVVRFTDRNYQIFLFSDIHYIRRHRFGIVIGRQPAFGQGLLRWNYQADQQDLIVIPSSVQEYYAILRFLREVPEFRGMKHYL